MVHSPLKTTSCKRNASATIPARQLSNDSAWINKGVESLLRGAEWVSPISKTAYARKHTHTGAVKAATIAAFNREDMSTAMRAVRRSAAVNGASDSAEVVQLRQQVAQLQAELAHEASAKGERVKALRKELAESEREKDIRQRKFDDAIRTSLRESFRLKNDLRVMIERATLYRDERDVADRLVASLQQSAALERTQLARAADRERALMDAYNASVAERSQQRTLVTALTAHGLALSERNDALHDALERSQNELGVLAAQLQALTRASDETIAHLCLMDKELYQRVNDALLN